MVEKKSVAVPSAESDPPAARNPSKLMLAGLLPWLSLAIATMAMLFSAYTYWQSRTTQADFSTINKQLREVQTEVYRRITEREDKLENTLLQAGRSIEDFQQLREEVQTLSSEITTESNAIEAKLVAIGAQLADQHRSKGLVWRLQAAEQILLFGEAALTLHNNHRLARSSLQLARSELASIDDPRLARIRVAIDQDITALQSEKIPKWTDLTMRINALHRQFEKLPLKQSFQSRKKETDFENIQADKNLGAVSSFWSDLTDLVQIRRMDEHTPALLHPEQRTILRQNLTSQLLFTELAISQRDQQAYSQYLNRLGFWLEQYFTSDNAIYDAIKTELAELQTIRLEYTSQLKFKALREIQDFLRQEQDRS